MPVYTFRKPSDGSLVTKRLSFREFALVKSGQTSVTEDNEVLEVVFSPGQLGFVMKDGESGGWASKVGKETQFRTQHNKKMAQREKDHVFKSKLVPNYNGQEAHCWSDVQDHVRTTKGVTAAKTYDAVVAKERSTP